MKTTRRKFTAKFKAQVAIEAIKERESMTDIAKRFEVHPAQITTWKREFLERAEHAFGGGPQMPQSLLLLRLNAMTCTTKWESWRCSVTF